MLLASLLIGLAGGLHCGLMCSPLQTAILGNQVFSKSIVIFHLGRLSSYVLIGLIFYALGESISFLGFQEAFVYLICAYIIYFYLIPSKWRSVKWLERIESFPYHFFKKIFSSELPAKSNYKRFLSGLLNGFLPCGLVYVAAANSILASSLFINILAMLLFGLATIPWLVGSIVLLKLPLKFMKSHLSNLKPYLAAIVLAFLLLRTFDFPQMHAGNDVGVKSASTQSIPLCGGN